MTAPGWYDDGRGAVRYWDGQQWTGHTAPAGVPVPDAASEPAHESAPGPGRRTWLPWAAALTVLVVLVGGGLAIWQVAGGPAEPEEVAEEHLNLMLQGVLTGETDMSRFCETLSDDVKSDFLHVPGDEDDVVDCDRLGPDTGSRHFSPLLDEMTDECRDRASAVTWTIRARSSLTDKGAEVVADIVFDGLRDFAWGCWDEDEDDSGTMTLEMVQEDGRWKVAAVDD